ncbi:hypothetical protein QBC41DRAFT_340469 [Cercophora samala]|uniref:Uncharacterized protein n=1 Tax=Cercophora samala TaxID=330535 RepID=A0AA39Z469_9PEZI|nr:hypothetical protein QBC41DRAFT_340469 [Cercophora samala]
MSLLGARPIRPGELNNYPGYAQRNEIVRRGDYLVQNYLEVPPHIQAAYSIITSRGGDWATVDEATICHTINSLPHGLTEHKIYSRENLKEPSPVDEPGYYQVMRRILTAESLFYQGSHARHILEQLRIPSTTPGSFKHHLQQANISIRLLLNFTRAVSHSAKKPKKLSPPEKPPSSTPKTSSSKPRPPDPQDDMIWPSLQYQNLMRQFYFFDDISRYLHPKQDNHTTLKHRTFLLPDSSAPHDYIDKGVCKINSHTLLFDTTLNNTLMKLIQEVDAKPGVIIREFSFWPDGADTNLPSTPDKWSQVLIFSFSFPPRPPPPFLTELLTRRA